MPHRTTNHGRERLTIAKTFVSLGTEMRLTLHPTENISDASVGTLLLVGAAVLIGHLEGRPMTASKLAHFVSLPRTTVLRRVDDLIELGHVVKRGQHYCI